MNKHAKKTAAPLAAMIEAAEALVSEAEKRSGKTTRMEMAREASHIAEQAIRFGDHGFEWEVLRLPLAKAELDSAALVLDRAARIRASLKEG